MIAYTDINGQRINFLTEDIRKYQPFSSIDSISLLIGINGSGKSKTLHAIAEYLGAGIHYGKEGGAGEIVNGVEISSPIYQPPSDYAVIYFTPLPWWRELPRGRRLIDASKFSLGRHIDKGQAQAVMNVARELKINVRLEAAVTHTSRVIQRFILPVLPKPHQLPYQLASLIEEYNALCLKPFPEADSKDIREMANLVSPHIMDYMHSALGDGTLLLLILAAIEKSTTGSLGSGGIKALLNIFNIFRFNDISPEDVKKAKNTAKKIRKSEELLSRLNNFTKTQNNNESSISVDIENLDRDPPYLDDTLFEIRWTNLSSGMLALIEQFYKLNRSISNVPGEIKKVIFLIDEGDAYLHLDWQRKYLEIIDRFLGAIKIKHGFSSIQLMLASHSPLLATELPKEMVNKLGEGEILDKTFAAPIENVIFDAFGTSSIGAFAAKKLNEIYADCADGLCSEAQLNLIEAIADEPIKKSIKQASRS